ncbi:MAG: hypothetical protein KYQ20_00465 [Candidatus Nealsonbacteria bacterium]|nr:hypothetical protein [Candidatus Nealsonbacteria bacterium]
MVNRKPINTQKYILTFCFTAIIFSLGFFVSDYLNNKRFSEINTMKQKFQIQVLAMETQLDHFKDILCADIGDDILTHELHLIGEKLEFMANNLGHNHPEVLHLKKYYSLLQIRHHHFSQQLCERCNLGLVHILYFFANTKYCPDCEKQSAVLSFLREQYPLLRIYSFDYNLDLMALAAIKPLPPKSALELNGLPNSEQESELKSDTKPLIQEYGLPIIVVEGKPFWGFKDIQEMKKILPLTRF